MRIALIAVLLTSCSQREHVPPKRPNAELITGVYERHPPDGETAIKFTGDGGYRIAKTRMQFDVEPAEGTGTYTLQGDTLTLEASKGMCADGAKTGTFKVVLSKVGVRFTKLSDACERRAKFDGQTWWRVE